MVGIIQPGDMRSIPTVRLWSVITNGYTDLIFKAVLSRNGKPDRIEGPNRLQSQLFASTPTWMARLERIPKYRKVDMKKNGQVPEPTHGFRANRWPSWRTCARRWPSSLIPGMPRLTSRSLRRPCRDLRNDATTEERVWAESRLVDAARRSDRADIVKAAEARLQPLKHLLAEEKKGRF